MSETPKTMDYWVAQQIVSAAAVGENKGAIAERERIIKLLEDDYFHLIGSAGETWNGKLIMEKVHLDGCLGCEQIALIKGENK
jgi:hypothetical protein